jgi:hypothetical protein
MQHLNSIKAAVKGKAPIVAIPIEGSAPVCVDRKRLAAWSKRVAITRIEVTGGDPFIIIDYKRPSHYGRPAEGPVERIETHGTNPRRLVIEGRDGNVKTRCSIVPIDRRTAVKTLAEWSEKERARQLKKTFLGALSKDEKKVMKLAKFDDVEGAGMVPVMVSHKDGKTKKQVFGVPVTIPELPDFELVIHRSAWADEEVWSVTERYTGSSVGSGSNPEAALVEARTKASKITPAGMATARKTVDAAKAALEAVAA